MFDVKPYLGLAPRWVTRTLGVVLMVCLTFIAPARTWLLEQARQHVMHEIQPMLATLVPAPDPSTPPPPPH